MIRRIALATVVSLSGLSHQSGAQASSPTPAPLGVWRGTSLCLVKPSSCNDEVTVYRISRTKSSDSVAVDARKIVNGQEEEMGVLTCRLTAEGLSFSCALPKGVWRFATHGDSLVGDLRLLDGTKFRDVRAVRSH